MKVNTISTQGLRGVAGQGTGIASGVQADSQKELTDKKLKEACQEFAAVFWRQVLRSMRKTIPGGSGFFGQGSEEKIYQDLLDEQYAIVLAKQDNQGLAGVLYEQLRRAGSSLTDSGRLQAPSGGRGEKA